MGKVPFKAVAVDMDGTFINSNNTYDHDYFVRVLNQLRKQHVHFIVASGRPLHRLKSDFSDVLDHINFIADNGALLVRDQKIINSHYFTRQTAERIFNFITAKYPSSSIIIAGLDNSYMWSKSKADFKTYMAEFYDYAVIDNFAQVPLDDRIDKITLWTSISAQEIEQKFNHHLLEKIHATSSGYGSIDIIPYGVNKANAIKYFLRYFKIKPEELIAFGDGMNDAEMLKLAGLSYAMANGDFNLKQIAKYVAPSNNQNGVLQVLEKYLNGKGDSNETSTL